MSLVFMPYILNTSTATISASHSIFDPSISISISSRYSTTFDIIRYLRISKIKNFYKIKKTL